MIEIELKFEIESPEEFLSSLQRFNNCKLVYKRSYDKTTMYDNNQRLMEVSDGRVRIRVSDHGNEVAYKKPISREGIKEEIEYETVIEKPEQLEEIFKEMGYSPVSSYERFRTEYLLKGVKITIDEYPFAAFVELEGSKKDIISLSNKLGFDLDKNITDSCDTLFVKWRKAHGLKKTNHMTFKGFNR